ncbi:mucin-2-like isoform X5 [Protopterus annectens]|uniref:mucin-2-like isoform X5 n=1 Tax=Protopterus annectens TaxID=7888 RepID=UPI001CFBE774|nr:mucin-2-like isoform X5 [Protopterus annectens]
MGTLGAQERVLLYLFLWTLPHCGTGNGEMQSMKMSNVKSSQGNNAMLPEMQSMKMSNVKSSQGNNAMIPEIKGMKTEKTVETEQLQVISSSGGIKTQGSSGSEQLKFLSGSGGMKTQESSGSEHLQIISGNGGMKTQESSGSEHLQIISGSGGMKTMESSGSQSAQMISGRGGMKTQESSGSEHLQIISGSRGMKTMENSRSQSAQMISGSGGIKTQESSGSEHLQIISGRGGMKTQESSGSEHLQIISGRGGMKSQESSGSEHLQIISRSGGLKTMENSGSQSAQMISGSGGTKTQESSGSEHLQIISGRGGMKTQESSGSEHLQIISGSGGMKTMESSGSQSAQMISGRGGMKTQESSGSEHLQIISGSGGTKTQESSGSEHLQIISGSGGMKTMESSGSQSAQMISGRGGMKTQESSGSEHLQIISGSGGTKTQESSGSERLQIISGSGGMKTMESSGSQSAQMISGSGGMKTQERSGSEHLQIISESGGTKSHGSFENESHQSNSDSGKMKSHESFENEGHQIKSISNAHSGGLEAVEASSRRTSVGQGIKSISSAFSGGLEAVEASSRKPSVGQQAESVSIAQSEGLEAAEASSRRPSAGQYIKSVSHAYSEAFEAAEASSKRQSAGQDIKSISSAYSGGLEGEELSSRRPSVGQDIEPISNAFSGGFEAAEASSRSQSAGQDLNSISGITPSHDNRVCSMWGNFHLKNFDGDVYDFPGTCNYLLTSNCKSLYEEFNIQVQRDKADGKLSTIQLLTMKLDGVSIEMSRSSVSVNGQRVDIPFSHSKVLIEQSIDYMKIVLKPDVEIKWNKEDAVSVELSAKYRNTTCGLCGDFNGIKKYDEFFSNGVEISPFQFGSLQKLNGPTEQCQDPEPAPLPNSLDYRPRCLEILSSSAFDNCRPLLDIEDFVQSCMRDMATCDDNSESPCFCETVEEYSRQCAHAGGKPQDWRTAELCFKKCPFNMEHHEYGSPCVETCSNPSRNKECSAHGVDGCFCPADTVYDDIDSNGCIPLKSCSCKFGSKIYAPGESYSMGCDSCTCIGGQWSCITEPCAITCSIEGGSHFRSFDGKLFDFHGDCMYTAVKDTKNDLFTILTELRPCGASKTETCMKKLSVMLADSQSIVVKPSGSVNVNQLDTQLPVSTANYTIASVARSVIHIKGNSGFNIVASLQPMMQVHISLDTSLKGQTAGLCGNYNDIQADDFRSLSGIVEGTPAIFGNTWKCQSDCSNVEDSYENPCALSVENEKYAKYWCSMLKSSSGPFSGCHAIVDPESYEKNCMYDSCNCEKSETCMCAALSSYARACAAKGIVLHGWKANVCKQFAECPEGEIFSYSITKCQPTCRSLSEPDVTCNFDFDPVGGCICEEGNYRDNSGKCVSAADCPCYYMESSFKPGEITHQNGALCTCTQGKLNCIGSQSQPEACPPPLVYINCSDPAILTGTECQKTCQLLDTQCYSTRCVSGCICPDGKALTADGNCIAEEQCPCRYNSVAYNNGDKIKVDCNTCTCKDRKWDCTTKECQATCVVYGEGHYISFDGRRFNFNGDCEYVLAQDYCSSNDGKGTFRIITENIPCGRTGASCSKSISLHLENTVLKLTEGKINVVQRNGTNVPYRAIYKGMFMAVEVFPTLELLWDKKTSLHITISPSFQGKVCGLCGNYDGNANNDFTTRSQSMVVNVQEFCNSWKNSPTCPDAKLPKDPCVSNPYRKAWAEKQCSIIISDVFSQCHTTVDPLPFYESCVDDACACDTGGDCECFCTAVAAYSSACNEAGICVSWRSPEICPQFCEYYNPPEGCEWHFKPCGAPGLKTCRNPSGNYSHQLPGREGCYPDCPADRPFFEEETMKCVSQEQCGCYDMDGRHYNTGDMVPSEDNCKSCTCTVTGISCRDDDAECYCVYDGKRLPPGSLVYSTNDGIGGCITAICGEKGEISRTMNECAAEQTSAAPFHFTTPVLPVQTSVPPEVSKVQTTHSSTSASSTALPMENSSGAKTSLVTKQDIKITSGQVSEMPPLSQPTTLLPSTPPKGQTNPSAETSASRIQGPVDTTRTSKSSPAVPNGNTFISSKETVKPSHSSSYPSSSSESSEKFSSSTTRLLSAPVETSHVSDTSAFPSGSVSTFVSQSGPSFPNIPSSAFSKGQTQASEETPASSVQGPIETSRTSKPLSSVPERTTLVSSKETVKPSKSSSYPPPSSQSSEESSTTKEPVSAPVETSYGSDTSAFPTGSSSTFVSQRGPSHPNIPSSAISKGQIPTSAETPATSVEGPVETSRISKPLPSVPERTLVSSEETVKPSKSSSYPSPSSQSSEESSSTTKEPISAPVETSHVSDTSAFPPGPTSTFVSQRGPSFSNLPSSAFSKGQTQASAETPASSVQGPIETSRTSKPLSSVPERTTLVSSEATVKPSKSFSPPSTSSQSSEESSTTKEPVSAPVETSHVSDTSAFPLGSGSTFVSQRGPSFPNIPYSAFSKGQTSALTEISASSNQGPIETSRTSKPLSSVPERTTLVSSKETVKPSKSSSYPPPSSQSSEESSTTKEPVSAPVETSYGSDTSAFPTGSSSTFVSQRGPSHPNIPSSAISKGQIPTSAETSASSNQGPIETSRISKPLPSVPERTLVSSEETVKPSKSSSYPPPSSQSSEESSTTKEPVSAPVETSYGSDTSAFPTGSSSTFVSQRGPSHPNIPSSAISKGQIPTSAETPATSVEGPVETSRINKPLPSVPERTLVSSEETVKPSKSSSYPPPSSQSSEESSTTKEPVSAPFETSHVSDTSSFPPGSGSTFVSQTGPSFPNIPSSAISKGQIHASAEMPTSSAEGPVQSSRTSKPLPSVPEKTTLVSLSESVKPSKSSSYPSPSSQSSEESSSTTKEPISAPVETSHVSDTSAFPPGPTSTFVSQRGPSFSNLPSSAFSKGQTHALAETPASSVQGPIETSRTSKPLSSVPERTTLVSSEATVKPSKSSSYPSPSSQSSEESSSTTKEPISAPVETSHVSDTSAFPPGPTSTFVSQRGPSFSNLPSSAFSKGQTHASAETPASSVQGPIETSRTSKPLSSVPERTTLVSSEETVKPSKSFSPPSPSSQSSEESSTTKEPVSAPVETSHVSDTSAFPPGPTSTFVSQRGPSFSNLPSSAFSKGQTHASAETPASSVQGPIETSRTSKPLSSVPERTTLVSSEATVKPSKSFSPPSPSSQSSEESSTTKEPVSASVETSHVSDTSAFPPGSGQIHASAEIPTSSAEGPVETSRTSKPLPSVPEKTTLLSSKETIKPSKSSSHPSPSSESSEESSSTTKKTVSAPVETSHVSGTSAFPPGSGSTFVSERGPSHPNIPSSAFSNVQTYASTETPPVSVQGPVESSINKPSPSVPHGTTSYSSKETVRPSKSFSHPSTSSDSSDNVSATVTEPTQFHSESSNGHPSSPVSHGSSQTFAFPRSPSLPQSVSPTELSKGETNVSASSSTTNEVPSRSSSSSCTVNGQSFYPGALIYDRSDNDGWCYTAICSTSGEILKTSSKCETRPSAEASHLPTSSTPTTEKEETSPGCTHLMPPRKYNEVWMVDRCIQATCKGDCIDMQRVTCPPVEDLRCSYGQPPKKIYDDEGCCFHYECEGTSAQPSAKAPTQGCIGPDGSLKQPDDVWMIGCVRCFCDGSTMSAHCEQRPCPEPSLPLCTQEGFVPHRGIDPQDPCCEVYECRCDPSFCSQNLYSSRPGFEMVVSIPQGSCCPVYKEVPKDVCVFNDIEYKPGSSIPSGACDVCQCSSDKDPKKNLNKVTCNRQTCNKSCELGFEYQEVSGQCCGQCVQKSCVFLLPNSKTHILKPGEKWSAPDDKCTHYDCSLLHGQFIPLTTRKLCADFNPEDCVLGSIEMDEDGCCHKCMPVKKTCGVQKKMDYVTSRGCRSKQPVELSYCAGSCTSTSIFLGDTSKMKHTCTCCREILTHNVDIKLTCPGGQPLSYSYIYVDQCGCESEECTESRISPSSDKNIEKSDNEGQKKERVLKSDPDEVHKGKFRGEPGSHSGEKSGRLRSNEVDGGKFKGKSGSHSGEKSGRLRSNEVDGGKFKGKSGSHSGEKSGRLRSNEVDGGKFKGKSGSHSGEKSGRLRSSAVDGGKFKGKSGSHSGEKSGKFKQNKAGSHSGEKGRGMSGSVFSQYSEERNKKLKGRN